MSHTAQYAYQVTVRIVYALHHTSNMNSIRNGY